MRKQRVPRMLNPRSAKPVAADYLSSAVPPQRAALGQAAIVTAGRYPNPMQRVAEPEEITVFTLYLASETGSYAMGQTFVVDGGKPVLAATDQRSRVATALVDLGIIVSII